MPTGGFPALVSCAVVPYGVRTSATLTHSLRASFPNTGHIFPPFLSLSLERAILSVSASLIRSLEECARYTRNLERALRSLGYPLRALHALVASPRPKLWQTACRVPVAPIRFPHRTNFPAATLCAGVVVAICEEASLTELSFLQGLEFIEGIHFVYGDGASG